MTDEEYLTLWRNRPASLSALLTAFESAVWQLARRFEYLSGLDAAGLANDARARALAAFDEFDPDRERAALFPFVYQRMRWHLMAVTKDESRAVRIPRKLWALERPRAELSLSDPKPGRKVRGIQSENKHPLDAMIQRQDLRAARRALRQLQPRLAHVIVERAKGRKLEAIAQGMNLSRERVRQLEAEALTEIRRLLGVAPAKRSRRGRETP